MNHTPGPWLAASKPSSVVGLPVVATRTGRSVASVSFFALGQQFSNHDAESQANAKLIAAAPDLFEACAGVWAALADTDDPRLAAIAKECDAALTKARG